MTNLSGFVFDHQAITQVQIDFKENVSGESQNWISRMCNTNHGKVTDDTDIN
jgi:hypothetical protein